MGEKKQEGLQGCGDYLLRRRTQGHAPKNPECFWDLKGDTCLAVIVSNHGASLLGHVQLLQGVRLCCIGRCLGKAVGGGRLMGQEGQRDTHYMFLIS